MDETETNIRAHQIETLEFLSSPAQQKKFASEVFYKSYASEFGCWWFEMFYPDEPHYSVMFNPLELRAIKEFAEVFAGQPSMLFDDWPIDELLEMKEWKIVVSAAKKALLDMDMSLPA